MPIYLINRDISPTFSKDSLLFYDSIASSLVVAIYLLRLSL
nr:MAG TPA: hypothetical protein [Caudoviricetes sp.]